MAKQKFTPAYLAELKAANSTVGQMIADYENARTPYGCEQQAKTEANAGNDALAYAWYNAAAGLTMGHARADWYRIEGNKHLQSVLDKHGIKL
jgi:hypothetical protein